MEAIIKKYINENMDELYKVFKELCLIPAPSHNEEKRAQFCKEWLLNNGAEEVYIDKALNVIYPVNAENSEKLTVFVAHTDTVFPDTEPMPYKEEGGKAFCPGSGDDTASLAILLFAAKFFATHPVKSKNGILFVCNSCEEGLGNLKGTRQIFEDYKGRIKQFVSFDCSKLNIIADTCVGSHRYEVTVKTEGGHSYLKFGNKNAACELAKMIAKIYDIKVPETENSKTTYNVGNISGGTSVNTIVQEAKMLCEYRSTHAACLEEMRKRFYEIFEGAKTGEVEVLVKMIGERPCADIDENLQRELAEKCSKTIKEIIGEKIIFSSSSTDCNIPLSMGIAAVAVGVYSGAGAHTREEWVDLSSLEKGLEIGIKLPLKILF